jgi:DNA-binding transcriptional ArsR family regulator
MAARPATKKPAPEPAANPQIRDFSRSTTTLSVEWDVRTAYDFVFSLSDDAGATGDLPQADRDWLATAKAGLRETHGSAFDLFAHELCIVLAGLAVDRPEVTDAASLLALIEATDDETIVRTILSEELRDPDRRDIAERAIAGDAAAIASMMEHLADHMGSDDKSWLARIYQDPRAVLGPLVDVLRSWLPRFQEVEPRVAAMIERDVELRSADAARLDPVRVIEQTTGGIRFLSEPGVRRVILAPSYFARPYNFLLGGADWRLFGYPIADAALDASDPLAPPPAMIRLHRALGDETRMRILRLLRDRDLYLTEIATELDLSKPTIKHHLALLRAAGLVTVTEGGNVIYYSLRRDRLDDASVELKRFLLA